MSVTATEKREAQENHRELLQTAGGMNQALLELTHTEHATVLKTLNSLYEYRISQERAELEKIQHSERVNKAFLV